MEMTHDCALERKLNYKGVTTGFLNQLHSRSKTKHVSVGENAVKTAISRLVISLVAVLINSPMAHSLDFEKEIERQEVVSHSIKQDLDRSGKSYNDKEKVQKKQDFQIVLLPKSHGN